MFNSIEDIPLPIPGHALSNVPLPTDDTTTSSIDTFVRVGEWKM